MPQPSLKKVHFLAEPPGFNLVPMAFSLNWGRVPPKAGKRPWERGRRAVMPAMNSNILFSNLLAAAPFVSAQLFTHGFAAKTKRSHAKSHQPRRLLKLESVTSEHWFRISFNTIPLKKIQTTHIVVVKRIAPVQLSPSAWMVCKSSSLFFYGMEGRLVGFGAV